MRVQSPSWLTERFHREVGQGFLRDVFDHLADGVCFVDSSLAVVYWNRSAERLTGWTALDVVGTRLGQNVLVPEDPGPAPHAPQQSLVEEAMQAGVPRTGHLSCRHREGHTVPLTARAIPVTGPGGELAGSVLTFSGEVEEGHLREQVVRLTREAGTDPLTGIPNRRALDEALDLAFYRFGRHGHQFGLIMIDLDHFKLVNDEYGHATGDLLLQAVARALSFVRRRDEVAARWGGEEFVVLAQPVDGLGELAAAADRIQRTIARTSIYVGTQKVAITASLGATLARSDDDAESLLRRADTLLYASKASGRNRSSVS